MANKSSKNKPGKTIVYDKDKKPVKTIVAKEEKKKKGAEVNVLYKQFEFFCKIFSSLTWTFDQYLLIRDNLNDVYASVKPLEQKEPYIQHLHYITSGKRVTDEVEIPRFDDFIKGIIINSKKETLPRELIIGSNAIPLPENISAIYEQFMADTWSNDPDAPVMPLHDFCMKYTPVWYKEAINEIVNKFSGQKQPIMTDTYGIVNVLRAWNLLDDFRLGNVIRLIAKTDHSELRDDLLEAKELIQDVLNEIDYKSNPGL